MTILTDSRGVPKIEWGEVFENTLEFAFPPERSGIGAIVPKLVPVGEFRTKENGEYEAFIKYYEETVDYDFKKEDEAFLASYRDFFIEWGAFTKEFKYFPDKDKVEFELWTLNSTGRKFDFTTLGFDLEADGYQSSFTLKLRRTVKTP